MQYIPFLLAILFAIGLLSIAANYNYIPGWAPIYPTSSFNPGSGSGSEGFQNASDQDCKIDPFHQEIGQPLITLQPVNAPQDDTISHLLHRTAFQSTPTISDSKNTQQYYVQQPALMFDGIWTRTNVKPQDTTGKQVRADWSIIREELLYPTHTTAIGRVFPANEYHKTTDPTMTVPPYISEPTWSACGDTYDTLTGQSNGNDINGL
jgi:hypothetical protein